MVTSIGSNRQSVHYLSSWQFYKGLPYLMLSILTDLYYEVDLYEIYPQERVESHIYYWRYVQL